MNDLLTTQLGQRMRALASCRILDTPAEEEFDEITRLASLVCETPIAAITLLDDHRQWFKSRVGLEAKETPLEVAFCAHAVNQEEILVVEDATRDPRFAENPLVTGEPRIRFYAGVPIATREGVVLGTLCVIDRQARGLSESQQKILRALARKASGLIEGRQPERQVTLRRPRESAPVGRRRAARNQRSCMELLEAVSEIAVEIVDPDAMLQAALEVVCKYTGWKIGHIWLPDGQIIGRKSGSAHFWRTDAVERMKDYRSQVEANDVCCTSNLLGRAMRVRGVVVHPQPLQFDLAQEARFLRGHSFTAGLAVPLLGREVIGSLELLGFGDQRSIPAFHGVIWRIGRVLGRALERQRSRVAIRRSEAYFRRLAEESLDLVTILDAQGNIRFESRSLEVELGWDPDELVGRSAFQLVHPDDLEAVGGAFAESLRTEGPTALINFRFRHKDGSYRVLEGRGNNLLSDPAIGGIVFASRDVTERKRLQEQFGQLAGGIAHDFNNLLTVIVGYSSRAETHPEADPILKQALVEIRRASQRAAGLTGQLLAFTGRQVLQPCVFQLNTLVDDGEKGLRLLLGEKIRLQIERMTADANVFADVAQLGMVLLNLANNSREAMPEGGVVRIETSVVEISGFEARTLGLAPGKYARLTLSDTGCGMEQEVRDRVFEPYFTTKPHGKGTGLSLAACKGIINQSRGQITVWSEPSAGAAFSIYLPIVSGVQPEDALHPRPGKAGSGRKVVLFAEDEEVLRELGVSVLEELGYEVLSAENGCAALALLEEHPDLAPDLLLTDIMMPEMNGKVLAEEVRKRHPLVPILFCSGYAQDKSFYHGLPPGSAFLSKPYTISALAEMVGKLLQTA